MLRHLHRLWGFDIHLHSLDADERVDELHITPRADSIGDQLPRFDLNIPPI
ncbi:MAG: spore cortex formation protein SpoVR/YcgB (stage V sporulation) [Halopseudomonas sp.]|jgi:spore cortex formation protein SpoVR/YcgB (stage V sporulation)